MLATCGFRPDHLYSSPMKQCEHCGKGSLMAGTRKLLRGHYNPTNWSRKYPNLQKTKLASGVRALLCIKCLRLAAKSRVVVAK